MCWRMGKWNTRVRIDWFFQLEILQHRKIFHFRSLTMFTWFTLIVDIYIKDGAYSLQNMLTIFLIGPRFLNYILQHFKIVFSFSSDLSFAMDIILDTSLTMWWVTYSGDTVGISWTWVHFSPFWSLRTFLLLHPTCLTVTQSTFAHMLNALWKGVKRVQKSPDSMCHLSLWQLERCLNPPSQAPVQACPLYIKESNWLLFFMPVNDI